jgi:hypothetical protein
MPLLAFILVVFGLLGSASASFAQDINCTGTVGGGATATAVNGNVTVPGGASCTLQFVNVSGSVQVQPGGSLVIAAYDEPSTISGNVRANKCASALIEGNVTVDGDVQIENCTGTTENGSQGPGIVIGGNFQCANNAGFCEAWLGEIAGNARIANNSGSASDVSLNKIAGDLTCQSNSAAPTHTHGYNWITGSALGQCASGFTTTSTSIGVPTSSGMACSSLASLPAAGFPVPNTIITSATDTPAGGGLSERCIVNGIINARTSPVDSCNYGDGFQVQLPLPAAWNGRFFMQGGGGTEGSVPAATGANSGSAGANFGITNGYAVASQDGGHENSQLALPSCDAGYGNPNEFYLDPMATIDQAYQSIEVTALTAKYLIASYYGDDAGHSYWVGCSTGGRQGMVMSQNFPQFFDGIVAGDPVYDLQAISLSEIWGVQQIYNLSPGPYATVTESPPEAAAPIIYNNFPVSDQSLFETALLQACDALDGVADGVIDNLPACLARFDPATATYTSGGAVYPLQCTGAKNSTCLSPAQIRAVKNIHRGPRTDLGQTVKAPAGAQAPDYVDNTALGYAYDGGYMTTVGIPARKIGTPTTPPGDYALGLGQFPYAWLETPDPTYNTLTFDYSTDLGSLAQSSPVVSYSTSLDISQFVNYGHKIIWYHGLSDPGPPVLGTILYYDALAKQHGGLQAAQSFSRLYPVPNMDHCSGGATTDQFDLLTPLTQWVEGGAAPGPIPATGVNFNAATYQVGFVSGAPDNAPTTRSRPLCPYPQEARFTGNTTTVDGVPVAANPADLANPANYKCIMPPPPYLQ